MLVQLAYFDTTDPIAFTRILDCAGMAVQSAACVDDALDLGANGSADVTVLLAPPQSDMSDAIRRLKEIRPGQPIVVASPPSSAEIRAAHLNAGADDHISTDADPIEVAARLIAIRRRLYGHVVSNLQIGAVEIDMAARTASVNGYGLALTRQEFQLLELLALHQGQPVAFDAIAAALSAETSAPSRTTVNACVNRLCQKLAIAVDGALHIDPACNPGYTLQGGPAQNQPQMSGSVH